MARVNHKLVKKLLHEQRSKITDKQFFTSRTRAVPHRRVVLRKNVDFLFLVNNGPGETNKTGLTAPKFGGNPGNHVAVSMAWEAFSGFMLTAEAHYEAWLAAWYAKQDDAAKPKTQPKREAPPLPLEYSAEP